MIFIEKKDEQGDKMKRSFCLFVGMFMLFLTIAGCQNSTVKTLENSRKIEMRYGLNDYTVRVIDEEEIKQLEDLFKEAEFSKSSKFIKPPYLDVTFYGDKNTTRFYIDDKDIIELDDGRYVTSEEVKFEKLISIYMEGKGKIENIIGGKIKNTPKIFMHVGNSSHIARIYNKEVIKQLEDLFNEAEFYETNKPEYLPYVDVRFYGKDGSIRFCVDAQDHILLDDGRCMKSKQISNRKLYSVFKESVLRNREEFKEVPNGKVKNLLEKKIENSSEVVIGYLLNDFTTRITNQEKIKMLEDLFNGAEFSKSNEPIIPALLDVTFYENGDATRFLISVNNVIMLEEGMYVKCKQISFKKLFSRIEDNFIKYQQKFD